MNGMMIGRPIQVVLSEAFQDHLGEHRGARIAQVVNEEQGIICAHVDLLPSDLGLQLNAKAMKEQKKPIAEIKDLAQPPYFYCGLNAYMLDLPYSEENTPGTWHWIEEKIVTQLVLNDAENEQVQSFVRDREQEQA